MIIACPRPAPGPGYEVPATPVSTAMADVTTITAHILGLWVYNSGTSPVTLSLKDRQTVPVSLPNDGAEIGPGSTVTVNAPFGLLAQNGFSISASETGLVFGAAWQ